MDPLEEIGSAQAARLVDEDGTEVELEFAPPLLPAEVERLEAEVGVPLPGDLRALLAQTAGIDSGPLEAIDFTDRSLAFGQPDLFPSGLPIAHDGFGNFWVLDLTPDAGESAPVFFACHDPPVVMYQSPDIGHFLHEAFRMYVQPRKSLVDDVRNDKLFNIWGTNPGTLDHSAALAGDDDLHAFAVELDERFAFVDLRSPEVGMGFSWGRYGPRTDVRRHGYHRLFAYARPPRTPGLLRRLFGTH